MKKLFAMVAIVLATTTSNAQTTFKAVSDTSLNADTIYAQFNVVPSAIKSFQLVQTRLSGSITTTGYALLQGTDDGTNWVDVNTDTLKLANAVINQKVWVIGSTDYISYRACIRIPTGTETSRAVMTYCRRPDEYFPANLFR